MSHRRIAQARRAEVRYRPATMANRVTPLRRLHLALCALALAAPAARAGDPVPPAPTAAQAAGAPAPAAPAPAVQAPAPQAPASPPPAAPPSPQAPAPFVLPPEELPLRVAPPVPIGFLLAWKPSVLSLRVDSGAGGKYGSDKFQPLRAMASYTRQLDDQSPFVGRIELEGGQFSTDDQVTADPNRFFAGSTGAEWIARVTMGASTKVSSTFNILGAIGAFSRYQWGKPSGGAPTLGVFGAVASSELEFRIAPTFTVLVFGEVALAPFPFWAQAQLGDLSDCSEIKGRLQLSLDVTPDFAVDVGFEVARWHLAFTRSTILGTADQALLIAARQFQLTLGARWKK